MTITQAVEQLKKLQGAHGNVEVYFDCPRCGTSFSPNKVLPVAVHLTQGEK